MKVTTSKDHTFSITISNVLYKKLKFEHDRRTQGEPIASYAVIGKLIEIVEKRLPSVTLNLKK